jgi:hypothetical protein
MSAPTRAPDPNYELAKAMGSKRGYDPMPPDQHEWQRAEGEPPLYRLWSWMCGHTIRKGHRSTYATEEGSLKPRTLVHAAKDLGMELNQVSRLWKWGEEKGLWHKNGGRELYLNGSVTEAQVREANKTRKNFLYTGLSAANRLKIQELDAEKRKNLDALWKAAQHHRDTVLALSIAEGRRACEQVEDNILRQFGLEVKRSPKAKPKPVEVPQLLLPFVQATTVQITVVHGTAGENDGERLPVEEAHYKESEKPFRDSSAAAISVQPEEAAALAKALNTDAAAAKTLLLDCRKHEPTVTVPEIVGLAIQKLGTPEKRAKLTNPIGLLIKTLPALCRGEPLARVRREIAFAREQMDREVRRKARDAEEDLRRCRDILEHPEGWDDQSIQLAREALERAENRQAKTAGGET